MRFLDLSQCIAFCLINDLAGLDFRPLILRLAPQKHHHSQQFWDAFLRRRIALCIPFAQSISWLRHFLSELIDKECPHFGQRDGWMSRGLLVSGSEEIDKTNESKVQSTTQLATNQDRHQEVSINSLLEVKGCPKTTGLGRSWYREGMGG